MLNLQLRSTGAFTLALGVLVGLIAWPPKATAQLAELVADLQDESKITAISPNGSHPRSFIRRGEHVFFVATDAGGPALWRTDGTPEGTEAVLSGVGRILSIDEDDLWVHRNRELWWTNGSPKGDAVHRRLGDLTDSGSFEAQQIDKDRILISNSFEESFSAIVATRNSYETLGSVPIHQHAFTRDKLFYSFNNSVSVTDGTATGTFEVYSGGNSIFIQSIATTDGAASWLVGGSERQIWRSSGDTATAELVVTAPQLANTEYLLSTPSAIYWIAGTSVLNLYRLEDGSSQPEQVTTFDHPFSFRLFTTPVGEDALRLEETQNGLYFNSADSNDDQYLWFVENSSPGAPRKVEFLCRSCFSLIKYLATSEDSLLFRINDDSGDASIWHTDSTNLGSQRVADCIAFSCGTLIEGAGFVATVNLQPNVAFDPTLVKIDPLDGSVVPLVDSGLVSFGEVQPIAGEFIPPETLVLIGYDSVAGSEPFSADTVSGQVTLLADVGVGNDTSPKLAQGVGGDEELIFGLPKSRFLVDIGRTSGSETETFVFEETFLNCEDFGRALRLGSTVICESDFDGIEALDLESGAVEFLVDASVHNALQPLASGIALFGADDFPSFGSALWATDGSQANTLKLESVAGGFQFLASDGAVAYYRVVVNNEKIGILSTDGTAVGTQYLIPLQDAAQFDFSSKGATLTDKWLYLWTVAGHDLQRVDRNTGQQQNIASPQLPESSQIHTLIGAGKVVEILVRIGQQQQRLRLLDNSQTPTLQNSIGDPVFIPFSGPPHHRLAGKILVFARDHVLELLDDGGYTEREFSLTSNVAGNEEKAFFAGATEDRGIELWGATKNETVSLLHDIKPGPASSDPSQFTVAGDRLYFTADDGIHGPEIWSLAIDDPGCTPTDYSLCLRDSRFKIDVAWEDFFGNTGRGQTRPVTDDSGAFWYFDDANLEAMVKVLDGTPITGHYWTFFGSLSNVAFALTVTDSETGYSRRYRNPLRSFASVGDNRSLDPPGASIVDLPLNEMTRILGATAAQIDTQPCRGGAAGSKYLCLRDGRFEASVTWEDFFDNTGNGTAQPLESDTGAFWFFEDTNLELLVKVLDGTPINGNYWVFYGALTNVAFEMRVRDTVSGETRIYTNPLKTFASSGDTRAFPN